MRATGNRVGGNTPRGFESLPFRHPDPSVTFETPAATFSGPGATICVRGASSTQHRGSAAAIPPVHEVHQSLIEVGQIVHVRQANRFFNLDPGEVAPLVAPLAVGVQTAPYAAEAPCGAAAMEAIQKSSMAVSGAGCRRKRLRKAAPSQQFTSRSANS